MNGKAISSEVSVVGAGMSGCLMSIYLARNGYQVDLFERRGDMRRETVSAGRSINLTLAARAIAALDEVGLKESILSRTVPLRGRMIHKVNGVREFQPYGRPPFDKIYSITRNLLNNLLLDAVETYPGVKVHFNTVCTGLDKRNRCLQLYDGAAHEHITSTPGLVIGADGSFSTICEAIQKGEIASRQVDFLDWGYKELLIPPAADGGHLMEGDVLHIWPRGNCLFMAMPNPDGSFTGTLCLPLAGPTSFKTLTTDEALFRYFMREFPDAMAIAPRLTHDVASARTAGFLTSTAHPWYFEDWVVLLGDACHTVLPFYGQGMNAAFEDCSFLIRELQASQDREQTFRRYQESRKRHTDALAALSLRNFIELRDSVRSPVVGYRKKFDLFLHRLFPSAWRPLYTMISHSTMPYADAVERAEKQGRILKRCGVDLVLRTTGAIVSAVQARRARAELTEVDRTGLSETAEGSASAQQKGADAREDADGLVPDAGGQRSQGASSSQPSLWRLVRMVSYSTLAIAGIAGFVSGAGRAALLAVVNTVIGEEGGGAQQYVALFAGLVALMLGAHIVSRLLLIQLAQKVTFDLRMRLTGEILGAPLRRVEETGSPRLLAVLMEDVGAISNALLTMPMAAIHISTIAVCMIYLGWLSPTALVLLVALMGAGAFSYRILTSRAVQRFTRAREDQNRLVAYFRAVADGNKEFKLNAKRKSAFVEEALEPAAVAYRNNAVAGASIHAAATSWGQFLFFGYIGLLVFWIAGIQGMDRSVLTGSTLVALYIIMPFELLLMIVPQVINARVSLGNIRRMGLTLTNNSTERDASDAKSEHSSNSWRTLKLSSVTKSYAVQGRNFRLGPLDLVFNRGELVFIMGGNGSGKSTLAKLVSGLYAPDEGTIALDERIINDSSRASFRALFSAVFSDFYLLENLCGIDTTNRDEKARELLRKLRLDDVVRIHDGELSTTALSAGQRRRLALLVACLEDRPIYLFDEWAADQDPVFKEVFYTELLPEMKAAGKTLIVITHDDRYVHVADRVIRLEDGKLASEGKSQTLSQTRPGVALRAADETLGIIATVGNTPLVRLRKVLGGVPFRLYAKMEASNPGGSIKDRSARQIITEALRTGVIKPGSTIVEASSGNMGIGLAQVCVYFGLRFICVVDTRTTDQNIQILQAYGATVEKIVKPDPKSRDLLQAKLDRVQEILAEVPGSFWPNQYANRNNSNAHYQTMREISAQVRGDIDYLFCATSTCGTLRGCSEYVREHRLPTKVVAVDAIGSVIFGGKSCHRILPGHGTARVPELHDASLVDRFFQVSDLDCVKGCRRLMREEAILAGGSSGGVLAAIDSMREEISPDATCVAIFADRGERYLNTIFSDEWVAQNFGIELESAAPRQNELIKLRSTMAVQ